MKGDPVPPQDFVARHCRFNDIVWLNGVASGVTEAAFRPRPDEDDGLSVNWVDFFQGANRPHKLACIRSITKLQVKDSHRIALLQVQDLAQATSPVKLVVLQDPDENLPPQFNAAHALIRPVADLQDLVTRQKLAARVKPSDLHPYK